VEQLLVAGKGVGAAVFGERGSAAMIGEGVVRGAVVGAGVGVAVIGTVGSTTVVGEGVGAVEPPTHGTICQPVCAKVFAVTFCTTMPGRTYSRSIVDLDHNQQICSLL
jgi:hypothetical protein